MALSTSRLQEKTTDRRGYGALPPSDVEETNMTRPPPPKPRSLWSALLFTYALPLIELGNARQLNADDLWETPRENRVEQAHSVFADALRRADGDMLRGAVRAYGPTIALIGVGALVELASILFAPVVLNHVIDAFTHERVDERDLTVWLLAFFGLRFFTTLVLSQVGFLQSQLMIRFTAAVRTILFEKALRRASATKTGDPGEDAQTTADLTNLFTADVNNVLAAASQVHSIWTVPLHIVGVVVLLYGVLGVAAFAGLVVIFLSINAGGKMATLSGQAFRALMQRKDTRMKLVKEVFGAIQVIKLNGWETRFAERILALRGRELESLWRVFFLNAMNALLLWSSPMLVSICSFAVYTLVLQQELTAAKVFTSMALFSSIRAPLTTLPRVFGQCIQAKVAVERMQAFLDAPEYDSSKVVREDSAYPSDVAIDIRDGSFGWDKETALLKNVNLTVKTGDFVVVHGGVGAGKSALCLALLGEMEKISGSVFVRGRVAYYSQQAWIQNLSIRDNILFGKAYDEALYKRVLDACGLVPDLKQLNGGDLAEIGQNGVNLSGGQKARLCLARACYADADVLVLDSPLAAVDAMVQAEIFRKCLCGLLAHKTVILVTHSPYIIASDTVNCKVEVADGQVKCVRQNRDKQSRHGNLNIIAGGDDASVEDSSSYIKLSRDAGSRLVEDEKREHGRVSTTIVTNYFGALGGVRAGAILTLILLAWQASQIASDLWLSHWTGQKSSGYDESVMKHNILVYVGLCALTALVVLARSITIALIGIRSARHLFEGMTRSLLKAPLRFFDANPIGRITNRYGDDMNAVDYMLPLGTMGVLSLSVFIIGQLGTAIAMVQVLGILVLPLLYVYLKTTAYYLEPSREIRRLVKVSDSPVLSFVTGSEAGVVTLRAFGKSHGEDASNRLMDLLNANIRAEFASTLTSEWCQVRIILVGNGILVVIVSALVYLHDALTPGTVGLAFTYTLNIQLQLIQVIGIWAFMESAMVSPERILEYSAIPPEGGAKLLQIEPSPQWPQRGTIDFDNVVFSYKEGGQHVLKGLSFSIKNNEKIGIVGRTGAGKSSLTMALFRINELVSGRVIVDGVDISTMPLQSLRSRLSIIPQAPVLFKGPLRGYMDPFEEYSDEQIWTAFEKVEMKEQIGALEGGLSYELSENGENFSVGERQMLCMARAMLTKSRIVVMDEATASIDHATEKKLQHMINRDFQEATVLTIAHRLATVLDSDRIMVLSEGRVVEFDTPAKLVQNESGVFYELAKEGGVLETIGASKWD